MAKVLVVSDSHGLEDELIAIKNRHGCKYNIHCGDSELDVEEPVFNGFIAVRGNCDFDARFPMEHILDIEGKKVLITHGHMQNVDENIMNLAYSAEEAEADIVCFGHTHVPFAEQHGNQFFINPGSLKEPRLVPEKTYAILDLKHEGIDVTFYKLDGSPVTELNRVLTV